MRNQRVKRIFKSVNEVRRQQNCTHAVLVGHNAHFDLGFVQAAIARTGTKNQNPFHSFSVFDSSDFKCGNVWSNCTC